MYPSIAKRIKASLADSVVIMTFITLIMAVYIYIGIETPIIFFLIGLFVFLYEPILVSWQGKTLGHKIFKFRVIDVQTINNISFLRAIARFIIKSLFGIVSLFWAFFTNRQQALHDIATRSIVISLDISDESIKTNGLPEIPFSSSPVDTMQVSIFRRVVVSLIWFTIFFVLSWMIYGLVVPAECLEDNIKSDSFCGFLEDLMGYIVIGILIMCFVVGSKGKLFGARSIKKTDS